jgi:proteic killer suppression protein
VPLQRCCAVDAGLARGNPQVDQLARAEQAEVRIRGEKRVPTKVLVDDEQLAVVAAGAPRRRALILSFGDKDTELIWNGIRVKNMPLDIQNIGRRKLRMLNNSQIINDLNIPPSNRLEKLSGNLDGFYSIRINNQWRIIFQWKDGQSEQVKIVDYH